MDKIIVRYGCSFDPVGKTIDNVFINQDLTAFKFIFADATEIFLNTDADCCSETWVEHINNFEYAVGATIEETKTTDLGYAIPTRQECDQLYSATIVCTRNEYPRRVELDIEFRNSSNGYYGGSIEWDSNSYGKNEWTELKEDF